VVLNDAGVDEAAARSDILTSCREALAPYKVPAMLRFTPSLPITAGGKLERAVA
jgi:acyl-CoA synthetase (AMP-forming)/AMP-acid ligase II